MAGLLLCLCTTATAQKKRPSWSQGLPKKNAVPTMHVPKTDSPSFQVDTPEPGVDLPVAVIEVWSVEPTHPEPPQTTELSTDVDVATATRQAAEPLEDQAVVASTPITLVSAASNRLTVQPVNNYSWAIQRQFPIKVSPATRQHRDSLLLEVKINDQGEVLSVAAVSDDTPKSLVLQASRAMQRWRFAAPADEGITTAELSRVLKVPLAAR